MAVPLCTPSHPPHDEVAARIGRLPFAMVLVMVAGLVVGAAATRGAVAGTAALTAVAVGLAILRRPAVGALVLVATVPVVSGLSRGLPVPLLRPAELLIVTVGVAVILLASSDQPVKWRAFDWMALAYVVGTAGLGAADVLQRGEQLTQDMVNTLLGPLQFLLLYRAILVGVGTATLRRRALALLLIAGLVVSVVALMQKFDLLGTRSALGSVVEGEFDFAYSLGSGVGRATGPFASWHALAGYLLIVLLVAVALLLEEGQRVARRGTLVAVVVVSGVALAATVSLAPIAGALVGVLALACWHRRLGRVAVILAVAAVTAGILIGSDLQRRVDDQLGPVATKQTTGSFPPTLAARWDIWTTQYLPQLEGRWATGYGPDQPPFPLVTWPSTESIYVEMLMRGGVTLLVLYLALMWTLAAGALRESRDGDSDGRAAGRALVVSVVVLAVIQAIIPLFTGAGVPFVLWSLAGIVLAPAARHGA